MNELAKSGIELSALIKLWPRPLASEIPEKDRRTYEKRELAMRLYCESYSMKEIEAATGIKRAQVHKLFSRCIKRDEYGQYLGFTALIPYLHLKQRNEPRENSMRYLLFVKEKEIGEKILNHYFNDKSFGVNKHCTKQDAFHLLHTELNKAGYPDDRYPKTMKDKGYKSFCRLLNEIEASNSGYALARSTNAERKLYMTTSTENPVKPAPERPYDIIEIDGHRVDAFYFMTATDAHAGKIRHYFSRPWLLAAIDVTTRAIVGYRLVFDDAYDQYDVLKLIESIIKPTAPIEDIREDGFPSQVLEEARWAVPAVIKLDNAMSHLARNVIQQTKELGIHLDFGPVETPVSRPHIERFFRTLELQCIRKLPSTCGSSPDDPVRIKAEENAVAYDITEEFMEKYIIRGIAEYNNTIIEKMGRTPIGKMRECFRRGLFPVKMPFEMRDLFHVPVYKEVTVQGSRAKGRRPYVQLMNHRYTSDVLADGYDLTHAKIILEIDPDDITVVKAFLADNGKPLGYLHMKGNHTVTKLSMRAVRKINAANREEKFEQLTYTNDIDKALERLESGKPTKKKIAAVKVIKKDAGESYIPGAPVVMIDESLDLDRERERIDQEFDALGYSGDELANLIADLI